MVERQVRLIGWTGQLSDHLDFTGSFLIREPGGEIKRMATFAESCTYMEDTVMMYPLVAESM